MKQDIEVPSVGESITSGVIVNWVANNGEQIQEGDIIFELETEKATLEVPSPGTGIIEILVEEGTEVDIGQTVGTLTSGEEGAKPAAPAPEEQPAAKEPESPQPDSAPEAGSEKPTPAPTPESPAVQEPTPTPAPEPKEPTPAPTAAVTPVQTPAAGKRHTEIKPMSSIRRRTAKRLVEATQNSAYLTTFNEIDMEKVMNIRTQYKELFQKEHGIRIGFMSFFVKACCLALKEFPAVNTQIDGEDIIYKYFYDIGVAISLEEGLIVPVIRDADTRNFAEIESVISDLATRAKEKKLMPDEMTGGTFTITNGGVFGSLMSTPIPAYPQTAILGMHAIKKRAAVVNDQIVIKPMMYVAMTYDHRVIDGRDAVRFLAKVKDFIEEPDKLLLEM